MIFSQPVTKKLWDLVEKRRTLTKAQKRAQEKAYRTKEKKRLDEWRKFLIEDMDSDWSCILHVFAYKLKRTRECIVKNDFTQDAPIIAKQMKEVEALFEKVIEEDNFNGPLKEMEKKWGKTVQYDYKDLPDGGCSYKVRREKETEENSKEVMRDFRCAYKDCHRLRVQALMKAFKIISEHIWKWWD